MSGFFDRMLGRDNKKGSSSTAKDRLQFVLLHERMNIPPEKLREMKQEIMEVIARYVPEIDHDSVEIAIEQSDRYNNKLIAEIPFTKARGKPADDITENDDAPLTTDDETLPSLENNAGDTINTQDTVKSKAIHGDGDDDSADDDNATEEDADDKDTIE